MDTVVPGGLSLGETNIKMTGSLIIPTATEDKEYAAVIRIGTGKIEIECSEKVFQSFNKFDAPKYRKVILKKEEIERIYAYTNELHIIPKDSLLKRYRNLFQFIFWRRRVFSELEERKVLLFRMENVPPSIFHEAINRFRGE